MPEVKIIDRTRRKRNNRDTMIRIYIIPAIPIDKTSFVLKLQALLTSRDVKVSISPPIQHWEEEIVYNKIKNSDIILGIFTKNVIEGRYRMSLTELEFARKLGKEVVIIADKDILAGSEDDLMQYGHTIEMPESTYEEEQLLKNLRAYFHKKASDERIKDLVIKAALLVGVMYLIDYLSNK